MFTVFLANAIVVPLLNIFDIFYLLKLLKRREIQKQGENSLYTQSEANKFNFYFLIKNNNFEVFSRV